MSESSDAQLAAALAGGDSDALAEIYDRYGGSLYDTARAMLRDADDAADVTQDVFVIAAQRIGQLRDPDRLKPWLFAILRNEVYRRSGKRKRTTATDFRAGEAEAVLPPTPSDDGSQVEYEELAALVREAAGGLDERDQFVLELSVRQGLAGADLADALGVSANESYTLVHRMRQRVERSLGALLVARHGRKDCPDLAEILAGWDGTFSVLIRKRVARHVDQCEVCERTRAAAAPLSLVAAAPVFAAPDGLRDRVLAAARAAGTVDVPYGFDAAGGFPAIVKAGRRLALLFGLGALIVLLGGAGVAWSLSDDAPDTISMNATSNDPGSPVDPGESGRRGPVTSVVDSAVGSTVVPTGSTQVLPTDGSDLATVDADTTTAPTATWGPTADSTAITTSTTSVPATGATVASGAATTSVSPAPSATTPTPADDPPTGATTTTAAPAPPPPPPPPPGALALSASNIDFGDSTTSEIVTLTNTGGQPVEWVAGFGPIGIVSGPFSVTPAGGSIGPGASQRVTLAFDRARVSEGSVSGSVTFAATGTSARVTLQGSVTRDPVLELLSAPARESCASTTRQFVWTFSITDETEPITATVTVTTPTTSDLTATTSRLPADRWSAEVMLPIEGGAAVAGTYRWTVTARDGLGLTSVASGSSLVLPASRCR